MRKMRKTFIRVQSISCFLFLIVLVSFIGHGDLKAGVRLLKIKIKNTVNQKVTMKYQNLENGSVLMNTTNLIAKTVDQEIVS